jgi:hypothetical protein
MAQASMPMPGTQLAWPAAVASVAFCALTAYLLQAYGHLHRKIISDNYTTLQDPLRTDLFRLLGYLAGYHLTGLLAAGFAAWTFRTQPRWVRWACLPVGLVSVGMALAVM